MPTEGGHEPGNERRRERGAELQTHGLNALHERPSVRWKPRLEYARRHWKDLGHAEQQLHAQQHGKQRRARECGRREWSRQRGEKGKQPDNDEHRARADPLGQHTAGELQRRIPEQEGPYEPADLHLTQAQLRHHLVAGNRQAPLLHIGDQAEAEQEAEDLPADPDAQGRDGGGVGRRGHSASAAAPIRSRT